MKTKMKVKIMKDEYGQYIIVYEGDKLSRPKTFEDLKKCDNATFVAKRASSMYEVDIDGRTYFVVSDVQKKHGLSKKFLFVMSDITDESNDIDTIEEKAFELYPDVPFSEDVASEDTFRKNEIRLLERTAFLYGYNEAMRWRDPITERPEKTDTPVILKLKSPVKGEDFYYSHDVFRKDEECQGFDDYADDDIIGWRPIE